MKTKRKVVIQRRVPKRHPRAIVKAKSPELSVSQAIEKVLIGGDLSPLTPEERVDYYKKVCLSLGLNPLTNPFAYILYKDKDDDQAAGGKLALYALRACTDQLRKIHGITVVEAKRWDEPGMLYAEATVRDRTGRTDSALGAIPTSRWSRKAGKTYELTGRELANAKMHVETKAKRRATLSICGLAFLDQSELDTMQVIGGVTADGRIYRHMLPDDEGPEPKLLQENLPHGHAQGTERAKQAEAALARVEAEDRKLKGEPQPELYLRVEGDKFIVSGDSATMNAHKELLLAYGKRDGQTVVMAAEGLDSFKHFFCEQRGGVLKTREPGAEG
jgi:hypothetical protein